MIEHEDDELEQLPDAEPEPARLPDRLPMLRCYGEGYITRKNGEVIPFTIQGEG